MEKDGTLVGTERGGGARMTTNNIMELTAACEGVEWGLREGRGEALEVVSDSAYVMQGAKKGGWMEGWKRNGWKSSSKKDVKNRDQWERLDRATSEHGNVRFFWVKAHDGNAGNERADSLALEMARRAERGDPHPTHAVDAHADVQDLIPAAGRDSEAVAVPQRRERGRGAVELKHFVNLTNGIELLPWMRQAGLPEPCYMRLESTACEQQRYAHILDTLDASLAMSLAMGSACVVYDCGSRDGKHGVPRALWYGTEFIKYALHSLWFPELGATRPSAVLRGYNVAAHWDTVLSGLPDSTKKRVRYYAPYARRCNPKGELLLFGAYKLTERDNDAEFYVETLSREAEVVQGRGWPQHAPGTSVFGGIEPLRDVLASGGLQLFESGSSYSAQWHASRSESAASGESSDSEKG